MTDSELAVSRFSEGWSCSQAVLSTFASRLGLEPELAVRVAAPFGGGMARLGRVCGAVTGAFMVIGLKLGNTAANDQDAKEKTYQYVRELAARFEERHGSIECRDLLEYDLSTPEGLQAAREQGLFTTLCPAFVRTASELVDELLAL